MSLPFQTERPSRVRVGNMMACGSRKLSFGEVEKMAQRSVAESAFVCGPGPEHRGVDLSFLISCIKG
jgi:hypothetical protein